MSSQTASPSACRPCKPCQVAKVKCSLERPSCTRCTRLWPSNASHRCVVENPIPLGGRKKRFHVKSREGCLVCRARRVKCDLGRPACWNCTSRGKACAYDRIPQSERQECSQDPSTRNSSGFSNPLDIVVVEGDTVRDAQLLNPKAGSSTLQGDTSPSSWLVSQRVGWAEQLADFTRRMYQSSSHLTFASHGIPLEYPLDIFPLLQQPNPFQTDNVYQQLTRAPSKTPLFRVFFPGLDFERRAVVPKTTESAETSQLLNHFLGTAVHSMICIKKPYADARVANNHVRGTILNPWLQHILPMLLSAPLNYTTLPESVALEALKNAIYSFASADIGFRYPVLTQMSLANGLVDDRNAASMRVDSAAYRRKTLDLLGIVSTLVEDSGSAVDPKNVGTLTTSSRDIALTAGLILCFRDRIAGEQDWSSSLTYVLDTALWLIGNQEHPRHSDASGGFSAEWPEQREFLVDQAVCTEMICCLMTNTTPKLLKYANSGNFLHPIYPAGGHQDPVEVCVGIGRTTVNVLLRLMAFAECGARLVTLAVTSSRYASTTSCLAEGVHAKLADFMSRTNDFLEEVRNLRLQSMMIPHHSRVTLGDLCFLAVPELLLLSEVKRVPLDSPYVQDRVGALLESVVEAMSFSYFEGLLYPAAYAALYSTDSLRQQQADRILLLLQPHCRADVRIAARWIALARKLQVHKAHRIWIADQKIAGCFVPFF